MWKSSLHTQLWHTAAHCMRTRPQGRMINKHLYRIRPLHTCADRDVYGGVTKSEGAAAETNPDFLRPNPN